MQVFILIAVLCFNFLKVEAVQPDVTVNVPMRDGTGLTTDIYLPDPQARGLPCILVRTPSGRSQDYYGSFIELAKKGYAVVIQDTRSAMDKEGKTMPYISDGWGSVQDGYDAVEWLAKSPWCNGKVGTIGWSAMGITQFLIAPSNPPSLYCQYIGMAASSLFHHAIYGGGQFHKNQVEGWLRIHARDPSVLNTVLSKRSYCAFWDQFNSMNVSEQVSVPAIHLAGWYDLFLQGTIDGFVSKQEKGGEGAKGMQKLIIGPWAHFWPKDQRLGDFSVPMAGNQPPVDVTPGTWFDHHLKGKSTCIDSIPPVTYYVMGPMDGSPSKGNRWKNTDQWPVAHTPMPFYLTSASTLESSIGDREIVMRSFHFDPEDPVLTVGGRNLMLESGAKDQRLLEARKDVLSYTSNPLQDDMEVTGRIKASLFITSEKSDADVAIRLCDVYPDGRSILVADGLARVVGLHCPSNHVNGHQCPPREVEVDLMSTSIVFAKGHSIRVLVAASNYPAFDKGDEKQANFLHVGNDFPSRITLPVVVD